MEDDLNWLVFIKCLRETGMSVEDIKKYYDQVNKGTSTLKERTKLIEDQKQKLLNDIEEKKRSLFIWITNWSAIIAEKIINISLVQ